MPPSDNHAVIAFIPACGHGFFGLFEVLSPAGLITGAVRASARGPVSHLPAAISLSTVSTAAPTSATSTFLVVGEHTSITRSPKFTKTLKAGDRDARLAIAKQQVETSANVITINVDEVLIGGAA